MYCKLHIIVQDPFFQAPSPAQQDAANNWKISNLLRNNRSQMDLGAQGDKEPQSQPNSTPASATASPAHTRKGLNLLPEVVCDPFCLSWSL